MTFIFIYCGHLSHIKHTILKNYFIVFYIYIYIYINHDEWSLKIISEWASNRHIISAWLSVEYTELSVPLNDFLGIWSTMFAKITSITPPLHLPSQCEFDTVSFKKWGLFPHSSNLDSELACDLLWSAKCR